MFVTEEDVVGSINVEKLAALEAEKKAADKSEKKAEPVKQAAKRAAKDDS